MRFAVVRLDYADALQVLVDHIVELIIGVEHTLEHRVHDDGQTTQADCENRDAGEEHQGDRRADAEREDPYHDHHDRGSHTHADHHAVGVLQIGHIGGEPGDDRTGGELVDVREAEALNLLELVLTQILRKARGGDRREFSGKEARRQGEHRTYEQDHAEFDDRRHAAAGNALIDQRRHDRRNQDFQHAFHRHERRRQQAVLFVFTQRSAQRAYQMLFRP